MATILFIISALCFLISNLILIFILKARKGDVQSDHFFAVSKYFFMRDIMNEDVFLEKITPKISTISITILMPTAISLAFYINWFLAFLIVIIVKFIFQTLLKNITNTIIVFFAKKNFLSSIITTFIVGIITLVIGILVR